MSALTKTRKRELIEEMFYVSEQEKAIEISHLCNKFSLANYLRIAEEVSILQPQG